MLKIFRYTKQQINQSQSRLKTIQKKIIDLWTGQAILRPIWYTDQHGVTCRLYPNDRLTLYLGRRSHFDDFGMLILVKRFLRPGMIVFDVGAHWGAFSLFTAQMIGPQGFIHAFEPTSHSYERLKENILHSKLPESQIVLNRTAVYNRDEIVVLNEFPPQFSVWNSLGYPTMTTRDGKKLRPIHSEAVKAITLDTYCQEHPVQQIDLLKIDVEGFEAEVIEGCSNLLKRAKIDKIIFEISLDPLKGTGRSAKQIIEAFANYDLKISRIDDNGEPIPITNLETYDFPFFANYLAEA